MNLFIDGVNLSLKDLRDLVFPRYCASCGQTLQRYEHTICLECIHLMPRTGFHTYPTDNPMAKKLWGRCQFENAAAWFYFINGSKYQNLIHKMKYNGRKDICLTTGKMYGKELNDSVFEQTDVFVPVPLHIDKFKQRGYNQSALIAQGLAESLHKTVNVDVLIRTKANTTQTNKEDYQRWENTEGIFDVVNPTVLAHKTVTIVDDVVTSGATMDACANTLSQIEGIRINLLALAFVG